ncbi:CDP-alcohol phosphatidyltransferase family protein [Glacieibacterium sp.]|uniref:CDP-alcohol phosphatidyltransferase family protein n=1 Tax=Glacieibacterium sp. TaxID=2860237 RepID=UPI003B00E030
MRPTPEARPVQIEDLTNRFVIHRLSATLLPVAVRLGIHPNAVSLTGLGCAFLSGAAYYHWREPLWVLLGFLLMCGWHICDGLDGQLARATGKATAFGRVMDGVCDYLAFFAVLIPVAISFPDWQAKLALALTAGAAHAVQAAWYEGEREAWKRRARGEFVPQPRRTTGHWIERGHNAMERALGSRARDIDRALAGNAAAQSRYFAATAPLLRALTPVSANGRTLAIPLFCLVGHAEWYWYWELFGLSLFALFMAALLRAGERRIVASA